MRNNVEGQIITFKIKDSIINVQQSPERFNCARIIVDVFMSSSRGHLL
jgi:hypothetical protein